MFFIQHDTSNWSAESSSLSPAKDEEDSTVMDGLRRMPERASALLPPGEEGGGGWGQPSKEWSGGKDWASSENTRYSHISKVCFTSFTNIVPVAGSHLFEKNKNRLSSTTCGEELQKIVKVWQSFKGLCQKKYQKVDNFKQVAFLTFVDL